MSLYFHGTNCSISLTYSCNIYCDNFIIQRVTIRTIIYLFVAYLFCLKLSKGNILWWVEIVKTLLVYSLNILFKTQIIDQDI